MKLRPCPLSNCVNYEKGTIIIEEYAPSSTRYPGSFAQWWMHWRDYKSIHNASDLDMPACPFCKRFAPDQPDLFESKT